MVNKNGILRLIETTVVFVFLLQTGLSFAIDINNPKASMSAGEQENRWNVYVYMDARNILGERNIDKETIKRIEATTGINKHISVYIDDRRDNAGANCIVVKGGEILSIKPCKGDLEEFLSEALSQSEKGAYNLLVLWGTADTDYFGVKGKTAVSWMSIGNMIREAEGVSGQKIDVLMIDACRSYSVLSLIGLQKTSSFLVASSLKIPMNGFPYGKILRELKGNPLSVSKMIVDAYIKEYSKRDSNAVVVNLDRIETAGLRSIVRDICKHRVKLKFTESLRKRIEKVYVPIGYWCFNGCSCLCRKILQLVDSFDVYYRRSKGYSNLPVMPVVKVFAKKRISHGELSFYTETLGDELGRCVFDTLSNPIIYISTF